MTVKDSNYLLILGASQFQRERSIIGAVRAYNGKIATMLHDRVYDNGIYFDIIVEGRDTFPEEALSAIIDYEQKTGMRPDAVIPLNDFVLNSGHLISEYYGINYLDKLTINTCREKDLLKECLLKNDVPVVKSYRFSSLKNCKELAKQLGFPVVIKPLNLGGSGGVKKASSMTELENAFLSMVKLLQKYASDYDSSDEEYIIEPYIESIAEVSVEVLNYDNTHSVIGMTDKFLSLEPYFSEIAHLTPSIYTQNIKIKEVAVDACRCLNINYGISHVEVKVTKDLTPIVIEVGARPAGDSILDIHEKSTGINFYELHIRSYLNKLQRTLVIPKKICAIAYIHPNEGVVKKINKITNDQEFKFVQSIQIGVNVNDNISVPKDWSTRYGHIFYEVPLKLEKEFLLLNITKKLSNLLVET